MSIADTIVDKVITQSLRVNRFESGVARKVRRMLKDVETDVVAQLHRRSPTAVGQPKLRDRRLKALRKQVRQSLNNGYRSVGTAVNTDLRSLAILESQFTGASINALVGAQVLTTEITPQLARSLVSNVLIQGAPSREWWGEQARTLEQRFTQQVRLGMAQGEGTAEIGRRIRGTRANAFADGILSTSRRNAEAMVRTSVQTVANDVRMATFQANDDVIRGVQAVVTLDEATTDICMALSGSAWDLDGEPLPESDFQGPKPNGPPFHWGCRTVLVAILKSLDEIAGVSPRKARQIERNAPPSIRATMDGHRAKDLTFNQFLKGKSKGFQNDILGKTRAGLWRDGRLPLHRLVDKNATPLSLEGLRKSVRAVTKGSIGAARAGEL